ncbi:hypothetical protein E2P81_ATG06758 [Venturia nashicola]|uniref:Uncharacterized protein n=1 Tax=Venturia nashicola TaxID=86259 RepID=A0A4Z1NWV5_9PEZI|nr:hypothetical protein E6O75_ATG06930 [Venturia nashicola]TLD30105.1 hypothetical protein E2P81_ATG06758 [Venturia nashicola]
MFHFVNLTALDNFIDKIAKEQGDPSMKNQDHSYLTTFLYDLAIISEWDTLGDKCLEEMETCSNLVSDLALELDQGEADVWYADIIYLLGEWHEALKWRREEYNRARKIRPNKKSPTNIEPQRLPDTHVTLVAAVPQATFLVEIPKPTLKRGREQDLEERYNIKRPRPETIAPSSGCSS